MDEPAAPAPAPAPEASAFSFLQGGQQVAAQPPPVDLASQLGSLQLGADAPSAAQPSAFPFTSEAGQAAPAAFQATPPLVDAAAQAVQLPQQAQPAPPAPQTQDQRYASLESSLSSLYQQQTAQTQQP